MMNSPATADCVGTCPSNDELKRYLSGWLNDARSTEVETHSANCSLCQKTLEQLELQPDTMMQSLQSTVGHPAIAEPIAPVAAVESESNPEAVVDAALVKVSRLFDVPPDADTDRDRSWQPPRRELGMYELIKPLGRGGMGAVYLASHKQLKKQVAIKLLPILSAEDSDVRARFDREIRVVGKLNHPSIVAATDAGEIDGTQFLVMEYVPGLDLSRLARLMGRLPVADACELIRQAALGLSCAHAEGVVHRDVKPSNLMLDESGRIRILDFGLAQLSVWDEASVDLTTVGQLMGTLDYMAPEQAEVSGGVDYRADLYALGATLFRLLCGRAPLAAAPNQSPFEKLRLLANHQPPKLSTLCPEAPEELVKLVASLLSRNPSNRPASAAHVAEQLAPFAEGSKLVDLLQQAKEKAATSPELLKKSAFADLPQFGSLAPAESAPLPSSSKGGRSKILRRLLLAASLPVLIIAGILIKLETTKGQLVIESDVDNVTVKLLKDGKPVDGIQVSHGTTSTRLNADNYEITIDGPSDGLVIDNDKFTLKNGETVVARITKEGDRPSSGDSESAALPLVEGVAVRAAASSLREYSVTLNDAVLQWLETVRLPNSDEVKADAMAFMEDVGQFQRSQGRESKPGELRSKLDRSLESWKAVYRHLGECRTVERGKLSTTAGKIRLVLTRLNDLVPKADSSDAAANAPLYEGKPLEHWLDMLSREKSATGLKSALDACSALGSADNAQQITATLLKALPTIDGKLHLIPGDGGALNPDSFSMQLLRKLNKGKSYFELWVREFDAADRDWQTRLWMYVNQYGPLSSSEDVEPLVLWAENRLAQPASGDPDANERSAEIANFLRNLTGLNRQDVNAKLIERVSALLKASPQLGETWWLSEPLVHRNGSEVTQLWSPQIKAEITRVAVEAVCRNDTDPSLVAQACITLSNGAELTNEQKTSVLNSIQRRLEEANQSPEALMSMVTIPEAFGSLGIPLTTGMSELSFIKIQITFQWTRVANVRTSKCSPVLQLLNVAYALDKDRSCQPQIQKTFDTSRNVFDIVHAQWLKYLKSRPVQNGSVVRNPSESTRVAVGLEWPNLTSNIDANSPVQPGTRDGLNVVLFRMLWGDHNPSKEDWLKYLILLHPVMQETVTAEVEKAAQKPPASEATDETAPVDSKAAATPSSEGNQTPK